MEKRRKSKPKIARPILTENKSKPFGTKKTWQKLKSAAAEQKEDTTVNDRNSVRFEIKDGEGTTNVQIKSSDLKIEDVGDDSLNEKSEIIQADTPSKNHKLNGFSDISNVKTIKEKHILPFPRAGSSKKERVQLQSVDSDKNPEKKSLLSKTESKKSLDATSHVSVDAQLQNNATVIYPPEENKPKSVLTNDESYIRSAIPYLPLGLSVMCLCLNIFIPGSGTMISGMSILCCGKSRLPAKDDQIMTTVCVNICVGVAQLFTVTFLLVGWFWSVAWGFLMVSLSELMVRIFEEMH